jgi:predicted nucleic acid-binding Zn ribbon protein
MAKKVKLSKGEQRSMRIQQVLFLAVSVIILLAMVLSLVSN